MSRTKRWAAGIALTLAAVTGLLVLDSVSIGVRPAQAVAVEDSGEVGGVYAGPLVNEMTLVVDGNVVKKTYRLTKGGIPAELLRQNRSTGRPYCTTIPLYRPSGCLERLEVIYESVGCDEFGDFVFTTEYRNPNSRQAPVGTYGVFGGFEFGDFGYVPAMGAYILEWRFRAERVDFTSGLISQSLKFARHGFTAASTSC